jgi:hypothetical protein
MKVKFFCDYYREPTAAKYQHLLIVLAEGLKALNIPLWGNLDYWYDHEEQAYLIQKDKEDGDADVHVYTTCLGELNTDFIKDLDLNKINVLLDDQDGWASPSMDQEYAPFDLVLTCHYTKYLTDNEKLLEGYENFKPKYLPNVRPWAYGLSNRMKFYIQKHSVEKLKDRVLINYRVDHNLRVILTNKVKNLVKKWPIYTNTTQDPSLENLDILSYWAQTGRRHNEQYYKDLNGSLFTLAFGGELIFHPTEGKWHRKLWATMAKAITKIQRTLGLNESIKLTHVLIQFDNWRFTEAMASNTIPLHIDYDFWNFMWPINPTPGKHYIACKGLDAESMVKEMEAYSEEELKEIAENGRQWILDNYSAKPTAERFLKLIDEIKEQSGK